MRYELLISEEAREQLRELPEELRRNIGYRLQLFRDDLAAALEMYPFDSAERLHDLKSKQAIGNCNITKCCTEVCPEEIKITDNAIIPLKERVVDEYCDPLKRLFKMFK